MKDGLSDFVKEAYSSGRVKNIEEAFKEFLVEEEWHKGKIEIYKQSFCSLVNKESNM